MRRPAHARRLLVRRFVALVSGLDLGGAASDPMALQLLVDLLTGQLGDAGQQGSMAKVSRLIVAGNCLSRETQDRDQLHKVGTMRCSREVMKFRIELLINRVIIAINAINFFSRQNFLNRDYKKNQIF